MRLGIPVFNLGIIACDVTHAKLTKKFVTVFHLIDHFLKSLGGLTWIGHHRDKEMRNIVVNRKFNHLRIDHEELNLIWASLH